MLGNSSLWLRCKPPRNMYKVRFDLGSGLPVRAGTAEENEMENSQETPENTNENLKTYSTNRLLRHRINNLRGFMREHKTRLRSTRGRRKVRSGLIASADFTLINSKKSLQKARTAYFREITKDKSDAMRNAALKGETLKVGESGTRCEECHKLMKERDKFWGLKSDSEEEDIKNFNEHVRRRSLRRETRTSFGRDITGNSSSSPRHRGSASRHKTRRIAGRGTWATPVYVPSWQLKEVGRSTPVYSLPAALDLEKARFGQKKGRSIEYFLQ